MPCLISRHQWNSAHPQQTMPGAWLPVISHPVGSLSAHKSRCTQSIYHAPLTMVLANLESWIASICSKSKSWLSAVFWLLLADTLGSVIPWHRWQSRGSCQNYTTAQAGEVMKSLSVPPSWELSTEQANMLWTQGLRRAWTTFKWSNRLFVLKVFLAITCKILHVKMAWYSTRMWAFMANSLLLSKSGP